MTIGATIPIVETLTDPKLDVAILKIDHSFVLPEPAEFYPLAKSHDFSTWPEDKLDGISVCMFGFPTANARPIKYYRQQHVLFSRRSLHVRALFCGVEQDRVQQPSERGL